MMPILNSLSWLGVVSIVVLYFGSALMGKSTWHDVRGKLHNATIRHRANQPMLYLGCWIAAFVVSAIVATVIGSGAIFLWFVVSVILTWWRIHRTTSLKLQNWRFSKMLSKPGFAIPISIGLTNGNYGRVDKLFGNINLKEKSQLVIGATGAGKSEAAKHSAIQMLHDPESFVFVFDRKTTYQDLFDSLGVPYIKISAHDSGIVPNFFQEFTNEDDIDQFARSIFPKTRDSDFFGGASRKVFAAILKGMVRENGGVEGLSNADLDRYIAHSSAEDIYEDLQEYPDLSSVADMMNPEAGKQSAGVYGSIVNSVDDMLTGDFACEPANVYDSAGNEIQREGYSIREHLENPAGVPVVFDFPTRHGDAVKPIFRFYIDHAAILALSRPDIQTNFLLDEFAEIPHLRKFGSLVNVGREENAMSLICLQSIKQLEDGVSEHTDTIVSGMSSMILLRPNDDSTVEFIRDSMGKQFFEYSRQTVDRFGREVTDTKSEEEHIFDTSTIRNWSAGEGVIVADDGWVYGKLHMLGTVIPQIRKKFGWLQDKIDSDRTSFVFIDRNEAGNTPDSSFGSSETADWVDDGDDDDDEPEPESEPEQDYDADWVDDDDSEGVAGDD